jgi:hypothetical protein
MSTLQEVELAVSCLIRQFIKIINIFEDLQFCYLHVCGLKSRLLCPDFINIIQQNDICVFTERNKPHEVRPIRPFIKS